MHEDDDDWNPARVISPIPGAQIEFELKLTRRVHRGRLVGMRYLDTDSGTEHDMKTITCWRYAVSS